MIELCDVSVRTSQFAIERISFRIETGQYAVLMGRTGHGKTTILEAVCGLRATAAGQIRIHGTDVTDWPPADREVGYVPQDLALFPTMTVRENVEFAMRLRKFSGARCRARADELSQVLGITHLLDRSVRSLSGGESQRVALGRALSAHPTVLLLDEPLSALDEATRQEMHTLLKTVQKVTGVTTLHVTHNADEAAALADRRLVLEDGQVTDAVENCAASVLSGHPGAVTS